MGKGRSGYQEATQTVVDELNARTRFECDEYFVSQKGIVKPLWFVPAEESEDSWEKSSEGIASEALRQKYLKMKAEYEANQEGRGSHDSLPG